MILRDLVTSPIVQFWTLQLNSIKFDLFIDSVGQQLFKWHLYYVSSLMIWEILELQKAPALGSEVPKLEAIAVRHS